MHMTKWIIGAIILILVVALAGYVLGRPADGPGIAASEKGAVTYLCDNGRSIEAAFEGGEAAFTLSDGRLFSLLKVPAVSGAKYTNRDGSIILWTKEYSAFLEENDESTYTGCVVSPLSLP